MLVATEIVARLQGWDLASLDARNATIYALRPDLTIAYRNDAWDRFAVANGAPELVDWPQDRPVLDVVAPQLADLVAGALHQVQDDGRPVELDYECSSPDRYRTFRMRVLPLGARWLLVVHDPLVERAHDRTALPPEPTAYEVAPGMIAQCASCRCTRRVDDRYAWDWVPAYLVRDAAQVSHGLCEACAGWLGWRVS